MAKAKKKVAEVSKLSKALAFLSLAQHSNGREESVHCCMTNQYATAFDSVIAAGTEIEEDLQCCPNTGLLELAIAKCTYKYVITQLSPEKLLVKSEDFQAYIPCLRPDLLATAIPDPIVAPLNDQFLPAVRKIAGIVSTPSPKLSVLECSIQVNAGSVVATNREVILEAWHGNDMPSGLLIPKRAASVLHKAGKPLKGFGFSDKTMTFYFADDTWLRTQLYQEKWPRGVTEVLTQGVIFHPRNVPPDLFTAAKRVGPFSVDGRVYISQGHISSHPFTAVQEGSALRLPIGSNDHEDRIYSIYNLKLIASHAVLWDERARADGTMFQGDNLRGLIYHALFQDPLKSEGVTDDDIPF